MHDYSKGRRPWNRGPKKRHSLYKAEDRLEGEDSYKEWATNMADAKGFDLHDFYPENRESKHFWQETYDRLVDHWYKTKIATWVDEIKANSEKLLHNLNQQEKVGAFMGRPMVVDKEKVQEAIENLKKLL